MTTNCCTSRPNTSKLNSHNETLNDTPTAKESLSVQHNAVMPLPNKAWYRQFWPWFLICLPLSAVIAGITTLIIAERATHQDIPVEHRKIGIAVIHPLDAQSQDTPAQNAAASSAEVHHQSAEDAQFQDTE